jgi:hypothetical protein
MTVLARDSRLCCQRRFSSGEEDYMTATHRVTSALAAACLIVTGAVTIHGDDLGSSVNQQLAAARATTARYHDSNEAIADGFTDLGPNPVEDNEIEFVNFGLVDCTLDASQPEALNYMESGDQLRLVGVEYSIPMACAPTPPEDFLPGAGEWVAEAGAPVWSYRVDLWAGRSDHSDGSH